LPFSEQLFVRRCRNPVTEPEDRAGLRVDGGDGALFDPQTAFLRKPFRTGALRESLDLDRQGLPRRRIGIGFRSAPRGLLDVPARVLEFGTRGKNISLAIDIFECRDEPLALLRRTLERRRKAPPLHSPRGTALFRRAKGR
jgi:hypothetical protein